jgi:hypothetical protein
MKKENWEALKKIMRSENITINELMSEANRAHTKYE